MFLMMGFESPEFDARAWKHRELAQGQGRLIMSRSLGHVRQVGDGRHGLELRQSSVYLPQEFDELTAAEQLMNKKPAKNSKEEAHDCRIKMRLTDMCRWYGW